MSNDFKKVLLESLAQNNIMATKEIYALFPEMNTQTVSWHLHKLLKLGTIVQVSHGCYSIVKDDEFDSQRLSSLQESSGAAYRIIQDLGFKFYLSGLDALTGQGFYAREGYPVIICVEKGREKDVQLELMRQRDFAIIENEVELLNNSVMKNNIQFYILTSTSQELSEKHFACPEKAFVDLYYCITHLDYPIAVQTLPHILARFKMNPYKFKMATRDRGLSEELNFLTCYNREFLREFANILK